MNLIQIPLNAIPSQSLEVTIEENEATLSLTLSQKGNLLLMDLLVNDSVIFKGLHCKPNIDMLKPFQYKINNLTPKFQLFFISPYEAFDYTHLESDYIGLYYAIQT